MKRQKQTKPNQYSEFIGFIPTWVKNKYLLTAIVFLFIIGLIGSNSLIAQFKLVSEINQLEKQRTFYQKEIEQMKIEMTSLENDAYKMEKVARENYFLKRPNEDVFLFEKE